MIGGGQGRTSEGIRGRLADEIHKADVKNKKGILSVISIFAALVCPSLSVFVYLHEMHISEAELTRRREPPSKASSFSGNSCFCRSVRNLIGQALPHR